MLSLGLDSELGKQLFRYSLTGGLNTAIGFTVIVGLLALGVADVPANVFGYLAGLIISFFVNRKWTFASEKRPDIYEILTFLGTFTLAYGINLGIVLYGQSLGFSGSPLLHFVGVVAYSAVAFYFSRNFVYSKATTRKSLGLSSTKSIAAVCLAIAFVVFPGMPMTHDVVWQFWIARQLNHGVALYSQINEVNPPLWFWMAMPLEFIGRRSGVDPIFIVQCVMIIMSAIACFLAGKLLPRISQPERTFFLGNAFGLSLFLAFGDFAQREQIAMILALPYLLLIVGRAQSDHISSRFALIVGLFAALGFALKHYFVVVPVLLEIWLIVMHRSKYRPLRPEIFGLVLIAAAYAVAITIFTPGYFTDQIPMIIAAYDGYKKPLTSLFNDREQLIWLFAIVAFARYGWKQIGFLTPLTVGCLIGAVGFFFSYAAQGKGWVYHSMPVSYFLVLALIAAITNNSRLKENRPPYYLACLALALGYILPVSAGAYHNRYRAATEAAIAGTEKGSTIFILSSDAQKGWPMVVDNGYQWSSRFMGLWMMPAIVAGLGDEKELDNLSIEIRKMILEDLQCNPPDTLLVDRAVINSILKPLNFDFMGYLLKDINARNFMKNYELIESNNKFDIYMLQKEPNGAVPMNCRKIF